MERETVEVAKGATIYHGGGHHGFAEGHAVPLPADHAAELRDAGHVVDVGTAEEERTAAAARADKDQAAKA